MAASKDNKDETNSETVEPLRALARQRIKDGELPKTPVPEEVLTYPPQRGGVRSPDDRPRDFCRLCGERINPDVIQWYRLPRPLKMAGPFAGTKPELHAACFTAWRLEVKATQQDPPEFIECTVPRGAGEVPLRFRGRIRAEAQHQDGDILRHAVLYETSDGQFVRKVSVMQGLGGFDTAQAFDTQEDACQAIGDETLRAELLRQLETKPT